MSKLHVWLVLCTAVGIAKPGYSQCRANEFTCNDGFTCLSQEQLCNNVIDCPDGEDENGNTNFDCTMITVKADCRTDEFTCRFGGCISKDKICNMQADCWGGSDESLDVCFSRPKSSGHSLNMSEIVPNLVPSSIIQTSTLSSVLGISSPTETMMTTIRKSSESTEPSYLSTGNLRVCPQYELETGENVECSHLGKNVDCITRTSHTGTLARVNCFRSWWKLLPRSISSTEKYCELGRWVGGDPLFSCSRPRFTFSNLISNTREMLVENLCRTVLNRVLNICRRV